MTFMVTSSNDDKSDICQFFIKTYSILSKQYMYKISCKMDKNFLRYSMFFQRAPTSAPPLPPHPTPTLRFSKKPSPGRVKLKAPLKKIFFWSNLYKIEVIITSLREMLELPNLTTFPWLHDHIYSIIWVT